MSSSSQSPEFPALDPGKFEPLRPVIPKPKREFVGARVYRNAAFSHTSTGNWQAVVMDSVNFDPHNVWSTANTRFEIPTGMAGYWAITGSLGFAGSITGFNTGAAIYLNGNFASQTFHGKTGVIADTPILPVHEISFLNSGDWVAMYGFQDSGGNHAYLPGSSAMWLGIHYLGTTGGHI